MQIPKDQILRFLEQHGQGEMANRAQTELPDQVDTEQHADLLRNLGVDPGSVLNALGSGGSGIAGKLGL